MTPEHLAEIRQRATAAVKCPKARTPDGFHTWSGSSFTHAECADCRHTRPRGERAEETVALLAEIDRLTPRQLTDVDEIEALPVGSILLEHIPVYPGHAIAWRKEADGWWYPSTFSWVRQRGALAMAGAEAVLIHVPAPAAVGTTEG